MTELGVYDTGKPGMSVEEFKRALAERDALLKRLGIKSTLRLTIESTLVAAVFGLIALWSPVAAIALLAFDYGVTKRQVANDVSQLSNTVAENAAAYNKFVAHVADQLKARG